LFLFLNLILKCLLKRNIPKENTAIIKKILLLASGLFPKKYSKKDIIDIIK
jgi:hypothetical protein